MPTHEELFAEGGVLRAHLASIPASDSPILGKLGASQLTLDAARECFGHSTVATKLKAKHGMLLSGRVEDYLSKCWELNEASDEASTSQLAPIRRYTSLASEPVGAVIAVVRRYDTAAAEFSAPMFQILGAPALPSLNPFEQDPPTDLRLSLTDLWSAELLEQTGLMGIAEQKPLLPLLCSVQHASRSSTPVSVTDLWDRESAVYIPDGERLGGFVSSASSDATAPAIIVPRVFCLPFVCEAPVGFCWPVSVDFGALQSMMGPLFAKKAFAHFQALVAATGSAFAAWYGAAQSAPDEFHLDLFRYVDLELGFPAFPAGPAPVHCEGDADVLLDHRSALVQRLQWDRLLAKSTGARQQLCMTRYHAKATADIDPSSYLGAAFHSTTVPNGSFHYRLDPWPVPLLSADILTAYAASASGRAKAYLQRQISLVDDDILSSEPWMTVEALSQQEYGAATPRTRELDSRVITPAGLSQPHQPPAPVSSPTKQHPVVDLLGTPLRPEVAKVLPNPARRSPRLAQQSPGHIQSPPGTGLLSAPAGDPGYADKKRPATQAFPSGAVMASQRPRQLAFGSSSAQQRPASRYDESVIASPEFYAAVAGGSNGASAVAAIQPWPLAVRPTLRPQKAKIVLSAMMGTLKLCDGLFYIRSGAPVSPHKVLVVPRVPTAKFENDIFRPVFLDKLTVSDNAMALQWHDPRLFDTGRRFEATYHTAKLVGPLLKRFYTPAHWSTHLYMSSDEQFHPFDFLPLVKSISASPGSRLPAAGLTADQATEYSHLYILLMSIVTARRADDGALVSRLEDSDFGKLFSEWAKIPTRGDERMSWNESPRNATYHWFAQLNALIRILQPWCHDLQGDDGGLMELGSELETFLMFPGPAHHRIGEYTETWRRFWSSKIHGGSWQAMIEESMFARAPAANLGANAQLPPLPRYPPGAAPYCPPLQPGRPIPPPPPPQLPRQRTVKFTNARPILKWVRPPAPGLTVMNFSNRLKAGNNSTAVPFPSLPSDPMGSQGNTSSVFFCLLSMFAPPYNVCCNGTRDRCRSKRKFCVHVDLSQEPWASMPEAAWAPLVNWLRIPAVRQLVRPDPWIVAKFPNSFGA